MVFRFGTEEALEYVKIMFKSTLKIVGFKQRANINLYSFNQLNVKNKIDI